jgi:hypothetical protein
MNNTKCRLINPTKSELGLVSKQMLAKIVSTVKSKSQLQQWKNTHSVIEWFTQLERKEKHHVIQFDVVDYYASITPDLIKKSIAFAEKYMKIFDAEKTTIFQACNSFFCAMTTKIGSRSKARIFTSPWGDSTALRSVTW